MNDNPFLTKRGFALLVVFFVFLSIFVSTVDSLSLFAPQHDEDGDIVNGLYTVGFFFAASITYFCEGYIGWKLGGEPKEYCKRKHKKEAMTMLLISVGAIILFGFLVHVDMSEKWAGVIACSTPWIYCMYLAFRPKKKDSE